MYITYGTLSQNVDCLSPSKSAQNDMKILPHSLYEKRNFLGYGRQTFQ